MATQEQNGDVSFFFYEANTVEAFLADPEKLPAASLVDAPVLLS